MSKEEDVQHLIDKKLARYIANYINQAWEHRSYYTGQHSMADIILEAIVAYERETKEVKDDGEKSRRRSQQNSYRPQGAIRGVC